MTPATPWCKSLCDLYDGATWTWCIQHVSVGPGVELGILLELGCSLHKNKPHNTQDKQFHFKINNSISRYYNIIIASLTISSVLTTPRSTWSSLPLYFVCCLTFSHGFRLGGSSRCSAWFFFLFFLLVESRVLLVLAYVFFKIYTNPVVLKLFRPGPQGTSVRPTKAFSFHVTTT